MRKPRIGMGLAAVPAVVVLLMLALTGPTGPSAQGSKIPVTSLKAFTSVAEWQIDITWHAKDAYEDKDWRASGEVTATARYVLKQLDRQDAWGHWQALGVQSSNITLGTGLTNKHNGSRLDYRSTAGPVVAAMADFQVGGTSPGYLLVCQAGFPVKGTDTSMGPFDGIQVLGTTQMDMPGLSGVCSGPLPASGATIHGSLVIPYIVPPFGSSAAPKTRLGIQYVIRPYVDPLAPLVPAKKR